MNSPGVVITGASGRMGQMLIKALLDTDALRLVGCIEHEGHPWLGKDIGACMGFKPIGVQLCDDPLEVTASAQAIIDFTTPDASVSFAEIAAQARITHVIGTTGFEPKHLKRLSAAARHAVIIRAGNMSLGVNLLAQLVEKVAKAFDTEWDIEIIETHHGMKVDAPSGTALMLGEAAAKGRGISIETSKTSGRDGITGARTNGSIGFSAVRGGDIIGEHDVMFAGKGERIILRHIATDRMIFAQGALKAAVWGQTKKPGEYDMSNVLGF